LHILNYPCLEKEQEGLVDQSGGNCGLNILTSCVYERQILTMNTPLNLKNAFHLNKYVAWYYKYFISI